MIEKNWREGVYLFEWDRQAIAEAVRQINGKLPAYLFAKIEERTLRKVFLQRVGKASTDSLGSMYQKYTIHRQAAEYMMIEAMQALQMKKAN